MARALLACTYVLVLTRALTFLLLRSTKSTGKYSQEVLGTGLVLLCLYKSSICKEARRSTSHLLACTSTHVHFVLCVLQRSKKVRRARKETTCTSHLLASLKHAEHEVHLVPQRGQEGGSCFFEAREKCTPYFACKITGVSIALTPCLPL